MFKRLLTFVVVWVLAFGLLGGGVFPFSSQSLPNISVLFVPFGLDYVSGMAFVFVGGMVLVGWRSR